MATRHTKKKPPLRVSVRTANIDPALREIRINKALDILIDGAIREAGRTRRRSKRKTG